MDPQRPCLKVISPATFGQAHWSRGRVVLMTHWVVGVSSRANIWRAVPPVPAAAPRTMVDPGTPHLGPQRACCASGTHGPCSPPPPTKAGGRGWLWKVVDVWTVQRPWVGLQDRWGKGSSCVITECLWEGGDVRCQPRTCICTVAHLMKRGHWLPAHGVRQVDSRKEDWGLGGCRVISVYESLFQPP